MGVYLKAKINCTHCGNEFFSRMPKKKSLKCPKCSQETPKPKNPIGQWYVDYYFQGKRIFECVGPNKKLALSVWGKRKGEIAENRFFPDKRKENLMTFQELATWYLNLSEVLAKKSYSRDVCSYKHLKKFFANELVVNIKAENIEDYKAQRSQIVKEATVDRELDMLKSIFSKAIKNEKIEKNPVSKVEKFKPDNGRDRVLSNNEWEGLINYAHATLKPILVTAYYTAMRKGEILNLTWDKVDLENRIIKLNAEDTKTEKKRSIPLCSELTKVLKDVKKYSKPNSIFVFTRENGTQVKDIRKPFGKALKDAGIADFVFHDFRHTAITNLRRAGVDLITTMKISGHSSMEVFKRYQTISKDDLVEAVDQLALYLDTRKKVVTNMVTKEVFSGNSGSLNSNNDLINNKLN